MRYRELTEDGDYRFGRSGEFLINTPAAVGQAVGTRLRLAQGEWFLDTTEGTPYATEILGTQTMQTHDMAIRDTILNTRGVTGIVDYFSSVNTVTRKLTVVATINTIYGTTIIRQVL